MTSDRDDRSIAMRHALHAPLFERETVVRICPECRQPMWQKHMEVCPGPMQRVAPPPEHEPDCGCPPGAWHLRTCKAAYWPEDAA